eukprot:1883773-Ditylum_brightwellii.AAC.1
MKALLHTLSSREDRKKSNDELLVDCQLMISYLGEQLYIQRAKTSEVQAGLTSAKRTVESLRSRNAMLEAENKTREMAVSRLSGKIASLEELLRKEKDTSSNTMKTNKRLQQERLIADKKHENECIEMRDLFASEKDELNKELLKERDLHSNEIQYLQHLLRDTKEKHEQE